MAAPKPTASTVPKDVAVIQSILKDMGVNDYEPAVVNQLLDFCYKYTTDILEDAKSFSNHANKKTIDIEDTKLAVQLKLDKSYTNPPPRELLLDIASHKNGQALPLIKPYTGPKLPPDRYCLSAMNYQLRKAKKHHAYPTQTVTVPYQRQGSQKSSLIGQVSLVGKQLIQPVGNIRPIKSTFTQRPAINVMQSMPGMSTGGIEPSTQVKRKLEPDDDYDA